MCCPGMSRVPASFPHPRLFPTVLLSRADAVLGASQRRLPTSPVARQTVAASRASYPMPRLADIPPVPTGLVPAADIKGSVVRLVGDRRSVNAQILALPPAPTDTERFVAGTRDVLDARGLTPPPADQPARTEAFASDIRSALQPPAIPPEPPPHR